MFFLYLAIFYRFFRCPLNRIFFPYFSFFNPFSSIMFSSFLSSPFSYLFIFSGYLYIFISLLFPFHSFHFYFPLSFSFNPFSFSFPFFTLIEFIPASSYLVMLFERSVLFAEQVSYEYRIDWSCLLH